MKHLFENELYTKPYLVIAPSGAFPLHYHRHIEAVVVMRGEIGVHIDGKEALLKEGDALLVTPYLFHGYSQLSKTPALLFKAVMEPECLGVLGELLTGCKPSCPIIQGCELEGAFGNAKTRLTALEQTFKTDIKSNDYPGAFGELLEFFEVLTSLSKPKLRESSPDSVFLDAIQLCCDNFSNPEFTISSLTEALYISRTRLSQLFMKHLNLGVKEYITLLRMSQAENYLADTDMSVKEISDACGYNNIRSFDRAFLRRHALTPTEFRIRASVSPKSEGGRKILSNSELFY